MIQLIILQKISLKSYLTRKEDLRRAERNYRICCPHCKKTKNTCYCAALESLEPETKFIILIHNAELNRSVATGRMAHLSLKGSLLYRGINFTEHDSLNEILKNKNYYCVLLYPGLKSIKLNEFSSQIPLGKQLVVVLLDATWHEARKMYRLSTNLHQLPMISFTPKSPSQFMVRTQPKVTCYSTIEAIHYVLSVIEPAKNFDGMLRVFKKMVNTQLEYEATGGGRK